jgi:hypothetical protein
MRLLAIHSALFLSGVVQGQTPTQVVNNPGARTPVQVTNGSALLIGPYDQSQKLRLAIGLKPPKPEEEQMFLNSLYTPGSADYHKFLTAKEWNDRFSPSPADEQAVLDWAESQGLTISNRFPNRLVVDIEAPVVKIQQAFHLQINRYSLDGKEVFSNDRDPVIPASVSAKILCVAGLNNIQVKHPHSNLAKRQVKYPDYVAGPARAVVGEFHADGDRGKLAAAMTEKQNSNGATPRITPEGAYEPTDLYGAAAYDLLGLSNLGHCCNPNNNPGGSPPETSIAIISIGSIKMSDIDGFQKKYPYLASNVTVIDVNGTPTTEDGEGTLDVEWAMAMGNSFDTSANTAHIYLYEATDNSHTSFMDLYEHVLSDGLTRVMSTSWGGAELFVATPEFMISENEPLNAMAGQGWTLVAASDDRGSVADCENVLVDFPASSPNVVAAGGTMLFLNSNGTYNSETAWIGGTFAGACSDNAGGGGGGFSSFWGVPFYQAFLGLVPAVRTVPDISLNAGLFQTIFLDGDITFAAGTSIVAPELAGFFAQENAYLLFLQSNGHLCFSGVACAPMGNANFPIYAEQMHAPGYAPHYPFYDIKVGCVTNDITANNPLLTFYCAGPGYDLATGLGSFNMLQMAWAINFNAAGDFGAPSVEFTGPPVNKWYNKDQNVNMGFFDTTGSPHPAIGLAGFSLAWDKDPAPESFVEATPGSTDAFYHGPQFPNQDRGVLILSQAGGQGCHTAHAKAWDNAGTSSGLLSYGPICYDTVAPATNAALAGTLSGSAFLGSVKVTLAATDKSSGVASTSFSLNGGTAQTYAGPFTIAVAGTYTLRYFSKDVAGNIEAAHSNTFTIVKSSTTTKVTSSLNPSTYGLNVTFTVTVTPSGGVVPTGNVTVKDGSTVLGTVSLSNGKATLVTTALHGGSHSITAVYLGSAGDAGSTSAALKEQVNKAATRTTLSSSRNPSTHGSPVTFTATVVPASGTPVTGTVTFKIGTVAPGVTVNPTTHTAALTTSSLPVGTTSITAVYNGSPDFTGSTSAALNQAVK